MFWTRRKHQKIELHKKVAHILAAHKRYRRFIQSAAGWDWNWWLQSRHIEATMQRQTRWLTLWKRTTCPFQLKNLVPHLCSIWAAKWSKWICMILSMYMYVCIHRFSMVLHIQVILVFWLCPGWSLLGRSTAGLETGRPLCGYGALLAALVGRSDRSPHRLGRPWLFGPQVQEF